MAEGKKGVGHAYNVDFLNVVFAASSLFLLLSVVWMVWDDYDREWKNIQRRFTRLEMQVTQAQLKSASASEDKSKLAALDAREKASKKMIDANKANFDDLQAKLKDAQNKLYKATLDYNYMKATYDQDRYDFEATKANDPSSSAAKKKDQKAQEERTELDRLDLEMQKATAEQTAAQQALGKFTADAAAAQKETEEMHAEQDRLRKRIDVIAPRPLKTDFRDPPLLAFLAPTLKVQQIILPNVVDDVNFIRVPKMDRCQTCHLAIDKKDSPHCGEPNQPACYSKFPQPFKNHPDLDLYLGGSSAHPI